MKNFFTVVFLVVGVNGFAQDALVKVKPFSLF